MPIEITMQRVADMLSEAGYFIGMSPDGDVIYIHGHDVPITRYTTIEDLCQLLDQSAEDDYMAGVSHARTQEDC